MSADPHEKLQRQAPYRKKPGEEAFFEALNMGLAGLDLPVAVVDTAALPVIYIVGVQRSGTTVLSQLVSKHLPVGYINNLISRFWLRPSVGIRLSDATVGPDAGLGIGFRSRFGTTSELVGPHEFGYFWRHWLRLDDAPTHSPKSADLGRLDFAGLKRAIEDEILGSFGRPVVFKNTICGLFAPHLAPLHERSLFIHIDRDPLQTAASILKTRKERYGSYEAWWSMKPSTYPFTDVDGPEAEVARQVVDLRREMKEALSSPGVRALHISYAELCVDPGGTLSTICDAIRSWVPDFQPRALEVEPLSYSADLGLPGSMRERLEHEIRLRSR